MPISYKNKIYTTLGTPTVLTGNVVSTTDSVGVPAKDYTVKGKTIVWNQLFDKNSIPNRNSTAITYSVDGNINILTTTNVITASLFNFLCPTVSGHKYMICARSLEWNSPNHSNLFIGDSSNPDTASYVTLTPSDLAKIFTATNETCYIKSYISYSAGNYEFKMNGLQLFDLTQMFGAGNEPSTAAEFRAMFPDDYYLYNSGELKTIVPTSVEASGIERFQMLDKSKLQATTTTNGVTFTNNGDGTITINGTASSSSNCYLILYSVKFGVVGHKYMSCGCPSGGSNDKYRIVNTIAKSGVYTDGFSDRGNGAISKALGEGETIYSDINIANGYIANNLTFKPQLFDLTQMFGAGNEPATPAEFWQKVPEKLYGYNPNAYKSANIPSSKYFPDGMRSAGSAYDEINFLSQKAIKRIGVVDMGTLNWGYVSGDNGRFSANVDGIKIVPNHTKGNLVCSKYTTASVDDVYLHTTDKIICVHYKLEQVWVYDTAYTDAAAFKAAMSGVMLYYELATPVETAITPPLQTLSTFNGFTSFSAPNSLTQNGPLSVTYYAEGGANPEKGWLTSYKRKLYMGRNIEWNQLLDKSKFGFGQTFEGITSVNNGDGSFTLSGTSTGYYQYVLFNPISLSTDSSHKYLLGGCPPGGQWAKKWGLSGLNTIESTDFGEGVIITGATSISPIMYVWSPAGAVSNLTFKPQLFDLTQMFGAGNEPATPAEFWSYFDHKLYPYNPGETQPLFKISRKSQWGSNGSVTPAAKTITVQETSFAPAVSKLCSIRKVRGSFAGTPTLYTTANNANKIEIGNNGYEWVTKVNDDNQIVSGNDFLDAFGINQTVDGTSLAGKTLGFMTHFSSRLSTTEGTDGGTFTSLGMSGEVKEIKSCEKEDLYCVVYNSETDTVKVYTLDEYDPKYGTFSVSAEIGYNTMIAFMLGTTEDEV